MHRMIGRLAAPAFLLLVAACTTPNMAVPVASPPPPPATVQKPALSRAADLPIRVATVRPLANADAALKAFIRSCRSLQKREDRSGLTRAGDWDKACAAAPGAADAAAFFGDQFRAVAIGAEPGKGFATGYFEPEIAGSRQRTADYAVPIYRRPRDLIEADLGDFAADLKGRKLRGRIEGQRLAPYPDRAAIMAGALAGQGLELAWAKDPYEAFFVEIQGSGRLKLPDGTVMRIGYDGQNGRDYVAIGRVLIDRGELPRGGANMDAILGWLRANPARAPEILAANPSKVFFRELTGEGPIGAMGVAVTPGVSVAADPAYVPLGAPLLVETTLPGGVPLRAMMVAQDAGGAIKGPNRIDLFRGAGEQARREAGAQAAEAQVLVLIPVAAAARLTR